MTVEPVENGPARDHASTRARPADRGGLKSGDVITHVNGHSIAGSSSEESTTRIKGPAGHRR